MLNILAWEIASDIEILRLARKRSDTAQVRKNYNGALGATFNFV